MQLHSGRLTCYTYKWGDDDHGVDEFYCDLSAVTRTLCDEGVRCGMRLGSARVAESCPWHSPPSRTLLSTHASHPSHRRRRVAPCSSCYKLTEYHKKPEEHGVKRTYKHTAACYTDGSCPSGTTVHGSDVDFHFCHRCEMDFCNGVSGFRRGATGWAVAIAWCLLVLCCW